jgi:zinc protease
MNLTGRCQEFLTRVGRPALGASLVLALTGAAGASMAKDIFPFAVTTRTLDNGLKVVMVPFDSPGLVAYYTIVRTGSRDEVEPGHSGFAHFFEHMMFRGTDRFSADAYNALFRTLGSDPNAYTSDDVTVFHSLVGVAGLESVIDIESDRFMHLKYSESDFKQEAKAVLGEYNKNYSNPENKLYEKVRDTAYVSHTYKHTTMGFIDDIKDMPNQYDYSREFFKQHYTPTNCVVLLVGDFDMEKAYQLVQKYYGPWKADPFTTAVPPEPAQTEMKTAHIDWPNATLPYVAVAFKMPAFDAHARDSAALDILGDLLFDETSPLYQELVIRDQKVDELDMYAPFRRDAGLFLVYAKVKDPSQVDAVRDRIYETVAAAAGTPVDPEKLAAVKSHIRYAFAMSLDTARGVAGDLTRFIGLTGDPGTINEMYRSYDEVTAGDLQRVAGTYLTREHSTEVTLSGGAQ